MIGGSRHERYALLYKAPFWEPGSEIQPMFRWVNENRTDHIGFLLDSGWRLLGLDSDIYGPIRITPRIEGVDEGGD